MAYQDDFRNKVLEALKAKNLAVDISQEATQQAIVEEAQNVLNDYPRPMSPEEMRQVLQDVANQLAAENQQFSAQSYDFTAYSNPQLAGGPGNYPGGGFAVSTASKDIMIIPTAGTAGSVNTLSQIDFKFIYNPLTYGALDATEVKSSIYNWAERLSGQTFDTPVLGIGGAWGGVSYTPNSGYGTGTATAGLGASIFTNTGRGNIIFLKPAISTINAALFNDVGLDSSASSYYFTITGYNSAVPNANPLAGFAVSFGGIGGSGPIGISGSNAVSGTQYNQIRFISPLTVSNSTSTDTLTLSLSSASGAANTQYFVGTGATQYILSTNSPSFAQGDIFYASGSGHTNLVRLAVGGNNTYLTSNGSVPSWTGSIAANTVAVNAATGNTILYPLLNQVAGSGSAISTDVYFSVDPGANILRYSSGSFYVGTAVSSPLFTSFANVAIRPAANTTTAIQLQNAAGSNILVVDSANNLVGINKTPATYALDISGDANVSSSNVYRINGSQVLSSTQVFGVTISSSVITVGSWAGSTITSFYGGTGFQTYTTGDLLAGAGATLTRLSAVAAGSFLVSDGTSTLPKYVAGSGVSVGLVSVTSPAAFTSVENYIPFVVGVGGVGLTITNSSNNLTYNPASQLLRATIITGTAVTGTSLTGTLQTASQPNVTSASSLATVGTIGTGLWQSTAIGTTYGGTGSNLGNNATNANKLVVLGTAANGYAATLIDGVNSGYFLMANGNSSAPSFSNSSSAAFTFTGGVAFNTIAATSNVTPSNANDLTNKSYVDSISGGLDPHASVRLTTIAAIGGSYRQAGAAGTLDGFGDYIIATTSAQLIGSMSGLDTPLSGVALTAGQRVLVKDGVTGGYATGTGAYGAFPTTFGGFASSYVANGIYTVASWGGAATTGWLLIRATDTDNALGIQELQGGTFTFIEEGSTYADNAFVCTNDTTSLGPIGFGSTQITWSAFSGGASLTMGQGLSKSGNTIATNLNLFASGSVATNLSSGFTIGGARSGSVGSSSYATWVVAGANALSTNTFTADTVGFTLAGGQTNASLLLRGVAANNTITGLSDGFTIQGGTTPRTLNVSTGDITLNGGGFTFTLGSNSTASFNGQTLSLTASMGNITFAGNANPSATTQTLVQNANTQYQLSSQTNTWAAGDMYYMAGSAFTALTRLVLGSGAGASVLVRDGSVGPKWGTIALGDSNFVSGTLTTTNGGTSNGSITTTAGQVVYTDGFKFNTTASGTAGQALLSNGVNAPSFGVLSLAGGGTSNTFAGWGISNQLAQYNSTGSGISSIALPTASNSVLIAPTPFSVAWSNGPLTVPYGGTNATATNFATNGVVIYDGTRLTSGAAVGLTMTVGVGLTVVGSILSVGTVTAPSFNIGGNSVVTSITPSGGSAIYGAVTIAVSNTNPSGALAVSGSGQNLTITGPATGITGVGVAGQVAYFSASSTATGSTNFTFSPTAATGVGLSVNVNSATGNIFSLNTPVAMTAGNLIDADVNGVQRFGVDFKGMTSITTGSGNTSLISAGGRTILAAPTANYATLNLASGTNPGSGLSYVGDIWYNGTNLYFKTGLTTQQDLLLGSVTGSGVADRMAKWSSGSGLTYSNLSESTAGVGMTITALSAVGVGFGATAYLTIRSLSGDEVAGIKNTSYFVRGVDSNSNRLFSVDVAGNLRATTKSFDIPHPTKEGLRLVYGVLEGPEHGVYHRGTVEGKGIIQVNLPDYWHKLVGDQYTVQLTPWGNYNVGIGSKTENYFTIQLVGDLISRKYKNIKVDYIVHGSRLDAPLDIEQ